MPATACWERYSHGSHFNAIKQQLSTFTTVRLHYSDVMHSNQPNSHFHDVITSANIFQFLLFNE